MPLPFVLAGAAVVASSYGAKKGYDGFNDKSKAKEILKASKSIYETEKAKFDVSEKKLNLSLEQLGKLQLNIGQSFSEFRIIAEKLQKKIEENSSKSLNLDIPKYQLDKVKRLELSTTAYLSKIAGAGVGGAVAAYAVYGGVMAFAAASTGTAISSLSGVAAYNATLAAIGGGSLATGGLGMAGGSMILGGVVAAPVIAIAGWAFASHAEDALTQAREGEKQVKEAVAKMHTSISQFDKLKDYVNKIYEKTHSIYTKEFMPHFDTLKEINNKLERGESISELHDEVALSISNGYTLAEILADIITTPLFKTKTDKNGAVILDKDGVPEFVKDDNDMKIINEDAIKAILDSNK